MAPPGFGSACILSGYRGTTTFFFSSIVEANHGMESEERGDGWEEEG